MRNRKHGFTLIEMMVVVLIIGILAAISLPYYLKTVEASKATDALGVVHMLGNAYRMFQVDNPGVVLSGTLTPTAACNAGACSTADTSACRLVRCNYVAAQDWDGASYTYTIGGRFAAGARRRNGASPGTTNATYTGWGYNVDFSGVCAPVGTTPAPVGF